jgi:regulator of sigma E protease
MYVVLAILALGFLIVVHEAGHYFVARWSSMRVERFSIGFGPAILKWKVRNKIKATSKAAAADGERTQDTQFQLAPIPFGGFVQIVGMNPHEEFDPDDASVYPNRPALLRFLTILAGPAVNYVFAVLLILFVYLFAGVPTGTGWHRVTAVSKDTAAAGVLLPGDRLVAVNGVPIFAVFKDERPKHSFVSEIQKAKGVPVRVTVERAGKQVDVQLGSRLVKATKKGEVDAWRVGVALEVDDERADVGIGGALVEAAKYPGEMTANILGGLYHAIRREVDVEVSGGIGIVDQMSTVFKMGLTKSLEMLALLSLYLGLFNLLPVPGLDGGRLAFLTYELATRRRANPKVEATVHMVGFVVLFLLVIVVTFKDIKKVFFASKPDAPAPARIEKPAPATPTPPAAP